MAYLTTRLPRRKKGRRAPLTTFATVEQLRQALLAFRETSNTTWLIERHGFRPPAAVRNEQLQPAALAA
jgi:putative transposase